ncbi:hypothetical protein J8273_1466 [Carpediemonas membranifera]|uniref:Uncharacterized protein n=1 Tax=Carpediemonas membranifera TaxID=201153 RepID=A0A8J6B062_9EUKA|nr:hypothetical protein J8273_1466 [Carpediemonas membranifera]|eukprot:KAG9396485.1 hypothetical protein J8273_1466 [Carpediemonas membranifera]
MFLKVLIKIASKCSAALPGEFTLGDQDLKPGASLPEGARHNIADGLIPKGDRQQPTVLKICGTLEHCKATGEAAPTCILMSNRDYRKQSQWKARLYDVDAVILNLGVGGANLDTVAATLHKTLKAASGPRPPKKAYIRAAIAGPFILDMARTIHSYNHTAQQDISFCVRQGYSAVDY